MADRKVIINDRVMEIIKEDGGVSMTGTQYGDAREVSEPTPNSNNTGKLAAYPSGSPDEAVSETLFLRTPGDVGSARWGWGDSNSYHGKAAAHVIDQAYLIDFQTTASSAPTEQKLVPLQNGKLLCIWLNSGVSGAFNYRVFDPSSGWGATATKTVSTSGSLNGITAVQFPDTNQIAVFVVEIDGSDNMLMTKWTSEQGTIAFHQAPTQIRPINSANYLFQGFDVEVMPNGNLTMLAQFFGSTVATEKNGLQGSFSSDRGATWSDWATAGDIGIVDSAITDSVPSFTVHPSSNGKGIPRIKRLQNGSFLAVAPGTTGDIAPITTGFTDDDVPGVRLLISDDGISWADALRYTRVLAIEDGGNKSFAFCLFPDGAWNASIAVGDDGLPRIYMAQHGGSVTATKSMGGTNVADNVALLTLAKPDITVKDVSPLIPQGATQNGALVSDMFDVDMQSIPITETFPDQTTTTRYAWVRKVNNANWENLSGRRINVFELLGEGSGDLDGTPSYKGIRGIDAVNYRGAIWQAVTGEDTAGDHYSLALLRTNSWSDLQEMPPAVDNSTNNSIGNVYDHSWFSILEPADLDSAWTQTIGGTLTMDGTTYLGMDLTDVATSSYIERTSPGLSVDGPAVFRVVLTPVSGGSASADNIAFKIQRTDGVNRTILSVRFVSGAGGSVKAYDNVAASDLGSAGADTVNGVEVVVSYTDYDSLDGVWIREFPSTVSSPEHKSDWVQIQGAATLSNEVGAASNLQFGHLTSGTQRSTWHVFQYKSAAAGVQHRVYDFSLATGNPWDAGTPVFHEFNDDFAQYGKQVHDDGVRHGTRAPLTSASPSYIKAGTSVMWRGAAGDHADTWTIGTQISYDSEKIVSTPVRDYWRSNDDASDTGLVLTATNSYFDPATIALFGINAHSFRVEFNNSDSWGSPAVSMTCHTAGGADADRHYYKRTNSGSTTFVAEGKQLRLTGTVIPEPFTPGQFKSSERVSWYMYSEGADATYKIIDNDNTRLFFDSALAGTVDDASQYIAIFPDKIAIDLLGGVLSKGVGDTQGYTHMRIFFPTQNVAEDYFKLGLVIAGRAHDLTDPHPEWGWQRMLRPSVIKLQNSFGHSENVLQSTATNEWKVGFNALVARGDRSGPTADPGNAAGFDRWLDFLEKSNWGERVVALLPDYNNHLDTAAFGNRSLEVFPVLINLPAQLTHVAYENCRANSGSITDVLNLTGITFEEIL